MSQLLYNEGHILSSKSLQRSNPAASHRILHFKLELIMSSPLLPSFNPNAKHPFTDHTKGVIPEPPSPSKYGRGVPPPHVAVAYPPTLPPPTPLVAPIPQYAPPQMVTTRSTSSASSISSSSSTSSSKPFTLFRLDGRGTPELEDVLLKKKSTWSKK